MVPVMGIKKNIKKLMEEPNEMRLSQISNILLHFGYKLDRIHGSHYIFVKPGSESIILPVHKNKITKHYLKDLKELIQTLQ